MHTQNEESNKFKKHLQDYWSSKGIAQIKIPQIGGRELNLYKLYKSVCSKGGGQAVSHNKMWKQIVDEFGLPSTCTSASFTLKNHYQKYLLGYEQRFFFGKDDSTDLPQLVAGRTRKPMTGPRVGQDCIQNSYNYSKNYGGQRQVDSTLTSQLAKFYEKSDKSQMVDFLKRTKMYPSMPQVKRMILGFQSRLKDQTNFSINSLMLYSVNTQAPFLFMQYPKVIESIYSFIAWLHPPRHVEDYQMLRTVTLAMRNLAIDYRNLQPIQQSSLIDLLVKIFEERVDPQVNRNLVDIFSSMANIGWDCAKLIGCIQIYLQKESIEDLQTGIDLLKTLVEEKEEICEDIIIKKIDFFARLLMHQQMFIRQAILQIFAYITDKSETTRQLCLSNFKFMDRIFAILSFGVGTNEKQSQLAGYILNNLAKSKENLQELKKFEKKIALVSFNDESLSSITTSLLFRLSNPCMQQNHNHENNQEQ